MAGVSWLVLVPVLAAAQTATVRPAAASVQTTDSAQATMQALQAQLTALQKQIEALQARLAALEQSQAGAQPAAEAPPPAQVPAGAAEGGEQGTLPVYGNAAALSKVFNPDIAVIGNFLGTAGENRVDPAPSLQLQEAELSLQAIVDPYARADFFLGASDEGLDVEEGFLTLSALPAGLLMKVGKMKAQFGKVNTMHAHVLPWTDVPLAMKNLLGGDEGFNDAGVSVSKLVLNPWFFLEATGEVYRGDDNLFSSSKRGHLAYVGRLRGYRDISESTNLDLGTSVAYGHNDAGPDFTTRVIGFDATFRYRPLRRAIYKRFLGRTEMFWSRRGQETGDAHAFGAYVSGEYQFARRWFAGGRYDVSDRAFDATLRDRGASLLLTYWPSEFSQIRGQYRHTRYAERVNANEVLFQFLFSIGAHGAHVF